MTRLTARGAFRFRFQLCLPNDCLARERYSESESQRTGGWMGTCCMHATTRQCCRRSDNREKVAPLVDEADRHRLTVNVTCFSSVCAFSQPDLPMQTLSLTIRDPIDFYYEMPVNGTGGKSNRVSATSWLMPNRHCIGLPVKTESLKQFQAIPKRESECCFRC